MGTFAKDNYETASRAAIVGRNDEPDRDVLPGAKRRRSRRPSSTGWRRPRASPRATSPSTWAWPAFDEATEAQLREIVAPRDQLVQNLPRLQGGLRDRRHGALPHAQARPGAGRHRHGPLRERDPVVERQKELIAAGRTGPGQHHESRPPFVEAEGVHHLMTFAELTGAADLHRPPELPGGPRPRRSPPASGACGVNVETLIQYLLLDKTYAERPDFEGAKYVMSPPLRDAANQAVLWNGLRAGLINTVATDHAPFDFEGQKRMGRDDFTKIPNGIPSLEERVNLLYTYGVKTGRIDLHTMVNAASTAGGEDSSTSFPARAPSSPAPTRTWSSSIPTTAASISARTQQMNLDYSAFEGWPDRGPAEPPSPCAAKSRPATESLSAPWDTAASSGGSRAISERQAAACRRGRIAQKSPHVQGIQGIRDEGQRCRSRRGRDHRRRFRDDCDVPCE